MKKKVIIVGYGNVGKKVEEGLQNSTDLELVGIVSSKNLKKSKFGVPLSSNAEKFKDVDVAILTVPSRNVEEISIKYINSGINTVDSYDDHKNILSLRKKLDSLCKNNNTVSIISSRVGPSELIQL